MGGRGGAGHSISSGRFAGINTFFQSAYGARHARTIMQLLQNAPAYIQQMMADYGSSYRAARTDPDETAAYYSPSDDSVTLGIRNVARGDSIHAPYATVFHEYGHMTDFHIARQQGYGQYASYTATYEGGLLGRTAKDELEGHLKRIRRAEPLLSRDDAARRLASEAKSKYSLLDRSDISDIMEGAGIGIGFPLGSGHGLDYWAYRDNGTEIFAEITSAEVASPGSLKAIKDYFPKTYKVYQKMVKERNKK